MFHVSPRRFRLSRILLGFERHQRRLNKYVLHVNHRPPIEFGYLHDLIVFMQTPDEPIDHVRHSLTLPYAPGLVLNLNKC